MIIKISFKYLVPSEFADKARLVKDAKTAKKGIVVTNTPEVLTEATADISILLLLGASRRAYEGRKSLAQSA